MVSVEDCLVPICVQAAAYGLRGAYEPVGAVILATISLRHTEDEALATWTGIASCVFWLDSAPEFYSVRVLANSYAALHIVRMGWRRRRRWAESFKLARSQ